MSSSSSCSGGGGGFRPPALSSQQQLRRRSPKPPAAIGASTIGRPSETTMTATHGGSGVAVSPGGSAAAAAAGAAGARSPPFRGRTMKEYEEMLGQLRKENFNLKLRLYFLEERGAGVVGGGDGGDAGAEVRLELEQLRRDAADKQQLLCEAARAVELLEEQHREQLRAARHAAQQAHVEAQQARAHAQQLAAEAERAREEAEAQVAAAKKAASDAAAEAALENERLRMELMQTREAAQEAAESARVARLAAAAAAAVRHQQPPSPPSPSSSFGGATSSEPCGGVRGAVERAQAQLSALEAELGAVRAELRRQTEARAAAERGLAEGRAVHAKSLQTVQALAKLCKERDREAEGLRARLHHTQGGCSPAESEERGRASGDEGVATPRPTPTGSPAPTTTTTTPTTDPPPPAQRTTSNDHHPKEEGEDGKAFATATTTAALLRTNVTLRRNVEKSDDCASEDERQREQQLLRAQLEDKNEHLRALAAERDALSGGLVRRLQVLQVQAREQGDALATRDQELQEARERASRLQEEVERLRAATAPAKLPTPPQPQTHNDSTAGETTQQQAEAEEGVRGEAEEEEDEKDRVIARLRTELRQRTANLQELVNKELWDKNRQIERLQERLTRLLASTTTATIAPSSDKQSGEPRSPPRLVTCPTPPPSPSLTPPLPPSPPTPSSAAANIASHRRDAASPSMEQEGVEEGEREAAVDAVAEGGGKEEKEEVEDEATVRRRLQESVRERACLAAQLEDLRRRVHDASTCSESGGGGAEEKEGEGECVSGAGAVASARAAQARAEADRRDALAACAALAKRLDALARALPPLLRRHQHQHHHHGARAITTSAGAERRSTSGSCGGRRLRALERALSAAARAARALGGVEGAAAAELAKGGVAAVSPVDIAVNVSGAAGDGASKAVWSALEQGKLEENEPADSRLRVSESEVDAWSEPDRTVSLARVGLSPLSDQRAAAATSPSSDEELDEAASHASHTGDPWASDDTIESSAEKVKGTQGSEIQQLQARVAELETRVCEKDNELLEQQCALLEMRNTYTARCLQAEGQLSELLVQVRQVQADAEAERRSVRDQREAEAERRRREADAELLQQRDAVAMAQSRAALERTQLLGERVRLERALRREEASAAAAARAYRHERRQLQDQVLTLQANNHKLNRQLADISVLHLSPPLSPSALHQSSLHRISGGGVYSPHNTTSQHSNMDHHLGVCPLSASYRLSRGEELGSLGSGLDAESLGSGSPPPAPLSSPQLPPGSPWQLNMPQSLPTFSRQHSTLSTGYASTGDGGLPTSPQTCGGSFNWITRPPGEPSHGAGSPDLGIESDAGRFSSLEPLSSHCGSCDQEPTQGLCGFQGTEVESDFARLQKENNTLRRNLSRTKKLLEATVMHLSTSNQMKRQMEMAICKQLNKTHSVLKQVTADSEVSVEPVK